MPNVSIDHGVMEGAENVAVVPLQAGWNDVGSWDALEAILPRDETGNLVVKGDLVTIESGENIVYSEKQMVALIGVNDLVVVDTGDTLLIGHKQQMQSVKELVERLREQGRYGVAVIAGISSSGLHHSLFLRTGLTGVIDDAA